jgi:phosphate/sulfate permease
MATVATAPTGASAVHEKFSKGPGFIGTLVFIGVLVIGIGYIGWSVSRDLANLHVASALPYLLIALGLGTMVGWKRIVVTVGEKIGKNHLTYAQGAAAEITAMATIGAADYLGLPVSTTHVLSSGVAGTMAANHSGLQWTTVRNLMMAWVLTLPVAMMLSGFLFWTFRRIF